MTTDHKITPGEVVTFWLDGQALQARRGQMLGSALWVNGRRILRRTRNAGKPRGLYCAMGSCFDCVVTVNGKTGVRACMTRVEAGMQVTLPGQFKPHESKT